LHAVKIAIVSASTLDSLKQGIWIISFIEESIPYGIIGLCGGHILKSQTFFTFELQAREGRARAGLFHTPHGDIPTPVFAPVGTQATVKAVTPAQIKRNGSGSNPFQILTIYIYGLGDELIARLGGLHPFMNWNKPDPHRLGGISGIFSNWYPESRCRRGNIQESY